MRSRSSFDYSSSSISGSLAELTENLPEALIGRLRAVHLVEHSEIAKMLVQRSHFAVIDLHPRLDRLFAIVVSLIELAAAVVAHQVLLRRVEAQVIHRVALSTGAPSGQPLDELLTRHLQADRAV